MIDVILPEENSEFLLPDNEDRKKKFKGFPSVTPDSWESWKTVHVHESSPVLLEWLKTCQAKLNYLQSNEDWVLEIKNIKNYLQIHMKSDSQKRVFAFVAKATGNIHTPALPDEPFDHCSGNILDEDTQFSIIGKWGVMVAYKWLPTHEDYIPIKR